MFTILYNMCIALVLSPEARIRVEQLWSTWGDLKHDGNLTDNPTTAGGGVTSVCPLLLSADNGESLPGARLEPWLGWE